MRLRSSARYTVTFALVVVVIYLPGWFTGRILGWW
jgi:hypothetical protein